MWTVEANVAYHEEGEEDYERLVAHAWNQMPRAQQLLAETGESE
jgi:hypothetical protein